MTQREELSDLNRRLNAIIRTRCDPVGCKNCDLKFGGFDSQECSATDLQVRMMDLGMELFG